MSEYPGAYLLGWCRNLPADHGLCLAHLYLICTAHDMSPLFLEGEEIWREFQNQLLRQDIPVRMAVRLTAAVASLSFLLCHLAKGEEISVGGEFIRHPVPGPGKTQGLIWREIWKSFDELTLKLCGPEHAADWLRLTLDREA